jgi:hypothetical protein
MAAILRFFNVKKKEKQAAKDASIKPVVVSLLLRYFRVQSLLCLCNHPERLALLNILPLQCMLYF